MKLCTITKSLHSYPKPQPKLKCTRAALRDCYTTHSSTGEYLACSMVHCFHSIKQMPHCRQQTQHQHLCCCWWYRQQRYAAATTFAAAAAAAEQTAPELATPTAAAALQLWWILGLQGLIHCVHGTKQLLKPNRQPKTNHHHHQNHSRYDASLPPGTNPPGETRLLLPLPLLLLLLVVVTPLATEAAKC